VLYPDQIHLSRSLRKTIRRSQFRVTFDQAFERVITACATPRQADSGTWISPEMTLAYTELHHRGIAHSVEVWQQQKLVGGLYGIALGGAFFGESMFSLVSDSSKVGFAWLTQQLLQWGCSLIDCQLESDHLTRLGAITIPRAQFAHELESALNRPMSIDAWSQNSAV